VVEPRFPDHVKEAVITRKFRGVEYIISVKNNRNDGEVKISVENGGKADGTTVIAENGAKQVKVSVTVG
jgi:cellobiose phosphorylase